MRRAIVNCPAAHTLRVLSGMWKVPIVWHLQSRTMRFSELRASIGKVTQKVLTQQLRELARDGIVHRKVYPTVPLKVEYSLSPIGKSLRPVIQMMCAWGTTHGPPESRGAAAARAKSDLNS